MAAPMVRYGNAALPLPLSLAAGFDGSTKTARKLTLAIFSLASPTETRSFKRVAYARESMIPIAKSPGSSPDAPMASIAVGSLSGVEVETVTAVAALTVMGLVALLAVAVACPLGSSMLPSPPPHAVRAEAHIRRVAKGIFELEFTEVS